MRHMAPTVIPGPLSEHLAPIPTLREDFAHFLAACFDTTALPATTLERCRRMVAALHDADPTTCGPTFAELPAAEIEALARREIPPALPDSDRLALEIASHIPWSHHDLTDPPVLAFREACGERAVVTLLAALAMFDALCRMTTVAQRLRGA